MALFQTQGLDGGPLQLELEVEILSYLYEQDKVVAFQSSGTAWARWLWLAAELKADWQSFLSFQADRAWEQELSGEENLAPCWTVGRSWRHEQDWDSAGLDGGLQRDWDSAYGGWDSESSS